MNGAALEMQIQTAIVKINGSHCGHFIIAHHTLGMNKAGRIFIDSDAIVQKLRIVSAGQLIYRLFIRDSRRDDE